MNESLFDHLRAGDVRWVRVVWCDNGNVIRAKAIHVRVLDDFLEHGVGISPAQQAIPVVYDSVAAGSGLSPIGEIRLVPDWSTMCGLPYAPGNVRVHGDMILDGQPWACCPRDFLKRSVAAAKALGFDLSCGFENEFYLMKVDGDQIMPADETVFAATASMDQNAVVINDITENLLQQEVVVEQYYPESGPGQQELSIRHGPPLATAERQIAVRETVRAIAARHGMRASFLPKIFSDKAGSGCHAHLSLWKDGISVVSDPSRPHGLSADVEAFMAGILEHLPALMTVTAPSPNSYRRVQPQCFAGAFRCWGVDNREAALRLVSSPSGPPAHFEFKTIDGSANPYLALGAIIACGVDGIRRKATLPAQVDVDPGALSDKDRTARGIERLPRTLEDAMRAFRKDEVLQAALGAPLARAFLAVRKAEWDALNGVSLEDEVSLLMERY